MFRLLISGIALTLFFSSGARAERVAEPEKEDPTIEAIYQQIHRRACTEIGKTCSPQQPAELEKWAFVATACERFPGLDRRCTPLPEGGPTVIGFDHDARTWRVIHGSNEDDIDFDVNGVPKVLANHGDPVVAVVESTNPLAYKVEAGAVTEVDAPVVADLKKLFAVLGPALSSLSSQAGGIKWEMVKPRLQTAQDAIGKISCVADQWQAAQTFTQAIEDRKDGAYQILKKNGRCPKDAAELDTSFTALDAALGDLSNVDFCLPNLEALDSWLNTSPTDLPSLRSRQKDAAIATLDCEKLLGDLKSQIDGRVRRLDVANPSDTDKDIWLEEGDADRKNLSRLANLASAASNAAAAGKALLAPDKRTEIRAVLDRIDRFEDRLAEHLATKDDLSAGQVKVKDVADFLVAPRGVIEVAWLKIRTRPLTITKASPFEKLIARRPDSLATSYGAGSLAASLTNTNVALTYTDLASPVFGLVSEAAPTAADPNATRNVIGQTDEERRAGKLAILVSFPIFLGSGEGPRRFGLEVGAGASTSTPALFLGLSAKLGGAVRLGLGITAQQVKELDGQELGDPLAAATDIKKKDGWDEAFYASFSLSLESIGGLFNAP